MREARYGGDNIVAVESTVPVDNTFAVENTDANNIQNFNFIGFASLVGTLITLATRKARINII